MTKRKDVVRQQIREQRTRAGLSQSQLAQAMTKAGSDMRQKTIAKIEAGDRQVSIDEAVAFAEVFGTTVNTLFSTGGPDWRAVESEIGNLLDHWRVASQIQAESDVARRELDEARHRMATLEQRCAVAERERENIASSTARSYSRIMTLVEPFDDAIDRLRRHRELVAGNAEREVITYVLRHLGDPEWRTQHATPPG